MKYSVTEVLLKMDCHDDGDDDDAKPTSSFHERKSRNGAKGGSGTSTQGKPPIIKHDDAS